MSVNVQTSDGLKPIAGYSKNDKLVHLILSYPDDMVGKVIYISNGMESYEVEAVEGGMIVDCKNLGQWLIEEPDNGIFLSVDTTFYGNYEVEVEKKFKKWLKLGRVSREFSSIEEILTDKTTLRQLMTIHASADYMLEWLQNDETFRSALLASDNALKWIGLRDYTYDKLPSGFISEWLSGQYWERALKDHVPFMTSNTAPYGTVLFDSVANENWYAYYAFDDNASSGWLPQYQKANTHIGYEFTNPMNVKKISINIHNGAIGSNIECKIIGSNSDINSGEVLETKSISKFDTIFTFDISNSKYYKKYYVMFATVLCPEWSRYANVLSLQFYGRSLNVSVPTMTSNNAPYGEAFGSSKYDSPYDFYKAFDGNDSIDSRWAASGNRNNYIGYDFKKPVLIKYYEFLNRASALSNLVFQGSNDKNIWENIGTPYKLKADGEHVRENVTNSKSYRYFRIFNDDSAAASTANFYGVDYSEREFEQGSTIKYLYDHGLNLGNIDAGGADDYSPGGSATFGDDYIELNSNYVSGSVEPAYADVNLDLTPYKYLFTTVGDVCDILMLIIDDTSRKNRPWNGNYWESQKVVTPITDALNITNMNGVHYASVGIGAATAKKARFTELWLE